MRYLVDVDEAITKVKEMFAMGDCYCDQYAIIGMLNSISFKEESCKIGKWEMLQLPINPPKYRCSVCGHHAMETETGCLLNRHMEANLTRYCPNCGVKMENEGFNRAESCCGCSE